METLSNRREKAKERRAASRHNLALPVKIPLAPDLTAAGSILVKTRDISTQGFYFNTAQKFTVGTKFEFSVGHADRTLSGGVLVLFASVGLPRSYLPDSTPEFDSRDSLA